MSRVSLTLRFLVTYAGFIVTYIAPLAFVLCVTMGKEAYDDYQRHLRDREANGTRYLTFDHASLDHVPSRIVSPSMSMPKPPLTRSIPSSRIRVGDMILLEKNMRIPADMVLLRTSEGSKSHGENTGFKPVTESEVAEPLAIEDLSQLDGNTPQQSAGGEGGTCFVRTDQLDGETDWKLRVALSQTQKMSDRDLMELRGELYGT